MLAGAAFDFLLALRDWAVIRYCGGFYDYGGFFGALENCFAHLLCGADGDPVYAFWGL